MEINSYLKDLCENNDYQPQEAFNPISTRGWAIPPPLLHFY